MHTEEPDEELVLRPKVWFAPLLGFVLASFFVTIGTCLSDVVDDEDDDVEVDDVDVSDVSDDVDECDGGFDVLFVLCGVLDLCELGVEVDGPGGPGGPG